MRGNDEAMIVAGEWMAKAENDLKSAAHLVKIADCPTDAVCFHAQQCVEKCLKALLVAQGTDFRKTHDLGELVVLLPSRLRPSLNNEEQDRLTEYATVTRYPGNYEPITLAKPFRRSRSRAASGGKSEDCSLRSLHFRMDGHDETLVTVADTARLAAVPALAYHGVARERRMV